MATYMKDKENRSMFETEMLALSQKFRVRQPQELSKDQCLLSVSALEQAKFESQKTMYQMVRHQKLQPQMINALIKAEKLKADDLFFNESGIEEEDIEPSIKRLGLTNDKDYKRLVAEWS